MIDIPLPYVVPNAKGEKSLMKIILSTGKKVQLPDEYNLQERMDFVEELYKQYPAEFGLREDGTSFINGVHVKDSNYITKSELQNGYQSYQKGCQVDRQETLVEYILQLDESYGKECLSYYKRVKRAKRELSANNINFTKTKITKAKDRRYSKAPLSTSNHNNGVFVCM